MNEIITCKVKGVIDHGWHGKRKVSAMCGRIKCRNNECSLPKGDCEYQEVEEQSK